MTRTRCPCPSSTGTPWSGSAPVSFTAMVACQLSSYLEGDFLGLVLALLPVGVLTLVRLHFVLGRGVSGDMTASSPSGRSCSQSSTPRYRSAWTRCGTQEGSWESVSQSFRTGRVVLLVVVEGLGSQLTRPRLKLLLVLLWEESKV